MRVRTNLFVCSVILFAAGIFITSCNNGSNGNTSKNGIDTGKKIIDSTPTKPVTKDISGVLDNLWATAADFNKLSKEQLIFSFTFRTNDTLTLYGWTVTKKNCIGEYQNDANIKLKKGKPSAQSYGPIVFFGNVQLSKKAVDNIQKKLGTIYGYVVFVPTNKNGFIGYEIFVTNDDPNNFAHPLVLNPTGEFANPSPPKNYGEE